MLLKALIYFARNFVRTPGDAGFRHVSGETYWRYRIVVEATLFAIAALALLAWALHPSVPMVERYVGMMIFPAVAALAALEICRLFRLLREQIEFAHLFYD